MFTVKINYGGCLSEEKFKTLKQAKKRWAGWYNHGLDVVGQIKSVLDIYDKDGNCIFSDMF